MWPFDGSFLPWFARRHDVLRVGRDRAELWAWSADGLVPLAHESLPDGPPSAANLQAAVRSLLLQRASRRPPVDVVLESAWLPVLALDPGPALLSRRAVEALLLHRVSSVHGAPASGGAWQLRVEHRAGDSYGIGFALAPEFRSTIVDAFAGVSCRVASIQPALSWGRARLPGRQTRDAWLAWLEQDRTLVVRMSNSRVRAMNPAAPAVTTTAQVRRLIDIDVLRQGELDAQVIAAGWSTGQTDAQGVTWVPVAATASAPDVRARTALEQAA